MVGSPTIYPGSLQKYVNLTYFSSLLEYKTIIAPMINKGKTYGKEKNTV
jgi:hypothetical protein